MDHTDLYELYGVLLGLEQYAQASDAETAQRLHARAQRSIAALKVLADDELLFQDAKGVRDDVWFALRELAG